MARFLSDEWFAEVELLATGSVPGGGGVLVVEQMVTGTPDGDVRYQVVTGPEGTAVRRRGGARPHVVMTTDYPTASAIAQGRLSAAAAVSDGRVRVSGNLRGMAGAAEVMAAADLVPAGVRQRTSY
jgi:putative sterol carrier protein